MFVSSLYDFVYYLYVECSIFVSCRMGSTSNSKKTLTVIQDKNIKDFFHGRQSLQADTKQNKVW